MPYSGAARRRLAAGLVAATAVFMVGCPEADLVTIPKTSVNQSLFKSYVALGNSLTAGYQSGGITDSTQRESYAAILAHQTGTRYAYGSLNYPGCPATCATRRR
jgi:hypothetical protein